MTFKVGDKVIINPKSTPEFMHFGDVYEITRVLDEDIFELKGRLFAYHSKHLQLAEPEIRKRLL